MSSSSSSSTNCRRCRIRAIAATLTDGDQDFRRIWREEVNRAVGPLVDSVYNRHTIELMAKMDRSRYGCDCGHTVKLTEQIEPDQNRQPNRPSTSGQLMKDIVKQVFEEEFEDDREIIEIMEDEEGETKKIWKGEKVCKGEKKEKVRRLSGIEKLQSKDIMDDSGQYREIEGAEPVTPNGLKTFPPNESIPKNPGTSTTMKVLEPSKDATATDDHHPLKDPKESSPSKPPPSPVTLSPTSRISSSTNRSPLRDLFPITSFTNGVIIVDSASNDQHQAVRSSNDYSKNIPENVQNPSGTSSGRPSLPSIQSTSFDRPYVQSRSLISNLYEVTLEQVKRDSIALKIVHATQQEQEKDDDDFMDFGQEVSNGTTNPEPECPETFVDDYDDDTTTAKEGSIVTTNKEVKEVEENKEDNEPKEKDCATNNDDNNLRTDQSKDMSKVALTTESSSSFRTSEAHFTLPPMSVLQSLTIGEFIKWFFINFDTAVINGTYHQGVHGKFNHPGVQCVPMCACAIVRSYLIRLTKWDRYVAFDPILEQGDILYWDSWNRIPIQYQPKSGHIFVNQLKKRNTLFGEDTILSFFDDPPLHGARSDQAHLLADLRFLFTKCLHGIVIAGGSARAVIQQGSLFYLFDSHSISPRGVPVPEGGRATIFYFFTLENLTEKLFQLINHGYVGPIGTEEGRDIRQDQYLIDPIRVRFPKRTELENSVHLDELDLDAYQVHNLAYSIESERIKAKKEEEVADEQMNRIGGERSRARHNKSKKQSKDVIWINLDDDDDDEEELEKEEKVVEEYDDDETECEEEMEMEMVEGNKEEGEKVVKELAEPKQEIKDEQNEVETEPQGVCHCPPESPPRRQSRKRLSLKRQPQKRPLPKDSSTTRSEKRARQSSPTKSLPVERSRKSVPSTSRSAERSRPSGPSTNRSVERSRESAPSTNRSVERSRQSAPSTNRSVERSRQSVPSSIRSVERSRQSVPSSTRSVERSRQSFPSSTRSVERSRLSSPSRPVLRARQSVPVPVNQKQITTLSLECDQEGCEQREIAPSQFNQHMLSVHSILPARCPAPECSKSFDNPWILKRHVHHSHQDIERWVCVICGTGYSTYKGLGSHTLNLHRRGQYRCTVDSCDFMAECKRDVYNHYAREHKAKFVCDIPGCDYTQPSEVVFKAHRRAHFDIRPYKCKWSQCEKTFVYKKLAMAHIRDHIGSVENGDELKPEAYLEVDTDLMKFK